MKAASSLHHHDSGYEAPSRVRQEIEDGAKRPSRGHGASLHMAPTRTKCKHAQMHSVGWRNLTRLTWHARCDPGREGNVALQWTGRSKGRESRRARDHPFKRNLRATKRYEELQTGRKHPASSERQRGRSVWTSRRTERGQSRNASIMYYISLNLHLHRNDAHQGKARSALKEHSYAFAILHHVTPVIYPLPSSLIRHPLPGDV